MICKFDMFKGAFDLLHVILKVVVVQEVSAFLHRLASLKISIERIEI